MGKLLVIIVFMLFSMFSNEVMLKSKYIYGNK